MLNYISFQDYQREYYAEHPERVPLHLDVALEEALKDGFWPGFMASLRTIVEINGGMASLAKELKCSRTTLYRTLSAKGNPRLDTLAAILRALGMRLSIQVGTNIDETDALSTAKKRPAGKRAPAKKVSARPRKPALAEATVVKATTKAKRVKASR